jgi:hypothetical protein
MIAYDLTCSNGHVFEGWFDSMESFEEQNKKKMVSCPYCDTTRIKKMISPVSVKKPRPAPSALPDTIDYGKLAREVVKYVQDNFDDVGSGFAAEALKIHYGVTEKRNIRGSATSEEEKTLKEEGVEFFKIPLPEIKKDKKN